MGVRLDAYTSRESTVYSGERFVEGVVCNPMRQLSHTPVARCFANESAKAVGILGDILTNSTFEAQAVWARAFSASGVETLPPTKPG